LVKPYEKTSDPQCSREADEDITRMPSGMLVGPSWAWALAGLIILAIGIFVIFLSWATEKSDGNFGFGMLAGLVVSLFGFFILLFALFWSENLRKYREERARAQSIQRLLS